MASERIVRVKKWRSGLILCVYLFFLVLFTRGTIAGLGSAESGLWKKFLLTLFLLWVSVRELRALFQPAEFIIISKGGVSLPNIGVQLVPWKDIDSTCLSTSKGTASIYIYLKRIDSCAGKVSFLWNPLAALMLATGGKNISFVADGLDQSPFEIAEILKRKRFD